VNELEDPHSSVLISRLLFTDSLPTQVDEKPASRTRDCGRLTRCRFSMSVKSPYHASTFEIRIGGLFILPGFRASHGLFRKLDHGWSTGFAFLYHFVERAGSAKGPAMKLPRWVFNIAGALSTDHRSSVVLYGAGNTWAGSTTDRAFDVLLWI